VKIKQRPEDFVVEELLDLEPVAEGPFGLYRLKKQGLSTPEAIERLRREKGLKRDAVACAGLKDKHAGTTQTISIKGEPLDEMSSERFSLVPLGRSAEKVESSQLRGNRFRIVIRDLSAEEAAAAAARAKKIPETGLPNYFDDQRFGSLRGADEFIARLLIEERFEEALKIAVASPGRGDHGAQKRKKLGLAERWGDWKGCLAVLGRRDPERKAFEYLAKHESGFVGAFDRLPQGIRKLYLYAYQSWVWNRAAERIIREAVPDGALGSYPYAAGELIFYDELSDEALARLRELEVPLPYKKIEPAEGEAADAVRAVLTEEGVAPEGFRLHKLRHTWFRRGKRALLLFPGEMETGEPEADELNSERFALSLSFVLPPGSYGTLVVKDVTRSFWQGPKGRRKRKPLVRKGTGGAAKEELAPEEPAGENRTVQRSD